MPVPVIALSKQSAQPGSRFLGLSTSPIHSSAGSSVLLILGSSDLGAFSKQTIWIPTTSPWPMDSDHHSNLPRTLLLAVVQSPVNETFLIYHAHLGLGKEIKS